MLAFKLGSPPPPPPPPLPSQTQAKKCGRFRVFAGNFKTGAGTAGSDDGFPPFLPKEVEKIKDPFARSLAQRIERLPVKVCIPFYFLFLILYYITVQDQYGSFAIKFLSCY